MGAKAADLTCHIDNTGLMAVIGILQDHAEQNPEIWECFDARFPNHVDIIAFGETPECGAKREYRLSLLILNVRFYQRRLRIECESPNVHQGFVYGLALPRSARLPERSNEVNL